MSILIFSILNSANLAYADDLGGGDSTGATVKLKNPLGENVTPQIFIGKIIKAILGIVGSLALVMFTP